MCPRASTPGNTWAFIKCGSFNTCMVYIVCGLGTLSVASNCNVISERWIGKDMEGSGFDQTWGTVLTFFPEGLKKTTENLRTVGLEAEIWIRHQLNKGQMLQPWIRRSVT
jgi:hypothetical protein